MTAETFLGQIWHDDRWMDYARGNEADSKAWQAQDPTKRRIVDWIEKGSAPAIVEATHVNYPHEPGRLYDCPACEAKCHCTPDLVMAGHETPCIWSGHEGRL